jgi:hypothetical protein
MVETWARARALAEDTVHQIAALWHGTEHAYAQARLAFVVEFGRHGAMASVRRLDGVTLVMRGSAREYAVAGLGAPALSTLGALAGDCVPSPVPDATTPLGEKECAGVLGNLREVAELVCERAGRVPLHGRAFILLESVAVYRQGQQVRVADRHRSRLLVGAGEPESPLAFAGPGFAGSRLPAGEVGAAIDLVLAAAGQPRASPPPDGTTTVVFAPACSGALMHEICGHLLEADVFARSDNRLRPLMGTLLTHPKLTLIDDSADPDSWASLHVDDCGNPGRAVTLIDSGHLAGVLTAGRGPQDGAGGHARRLDYRYPALPRMTTMSVLPGPDAAADVLSGVRDGIYAEVIGRAACDPVTGRFVAQVDQGRRIRHGELCEPLTPAHINGDVVATLASVRAVCADSIANDSGCVKQNQAVANRSIGPTMLITDVACAPRAS